MYHEDELVAFVLKHSKTLKQFVLKGPVLSQRSWKTALKKLLRVQFCSMQYLELSNMNRFKDGHSNVEKLHHEWREFQVNATQLMEDANVPYTLFLRSGKWTFVFDPARK